VRATGLSHPRVKLTRVTHGGGFDPWRSIDAHQDLLVTFDPVARLMGGGFQVADGPRSYIVVDPDLDEAARRAVLTHELIHHERGGGPARSEWSSGRDGLVSRDERQVEAEVARRLVPDDELVALIHERLAVDEGVDRAEVAVQFCVPLDVAELALRQLRGIDESAPGTGRRASR
jgi:hypothetical protein